jgi:uncharacterized damage-inducible protein DinB
MNRDTLLTLYHFHADANATVFDTAAHISAVDLARETSPSHGSILKILRHLLGGEFYFLHVCQGEQPDSADLRALDVLDTLAAIRARMEQTTAEVLRYIEGLSEDELQADVEFALGEHTFTLKRWQMLVQLIFHAHMHRGELSIVMSTLGYPLPTIDMMVHFIIASGQEWPF